MKLNPKFHYLSENMMLKMFNTMYSIEEAKQIFLECFPGMKSIKFQEDYD